MRRLLPVAASMLLLFVAVWPTAAQQDLPPTLRVVETDPLRGQELELSEPISIYFDRPLDCNTSNNAVSLTPSVSGTLDCNGQAASLTFTPQNAQYQRATQYTVTVNPTLQAADGATLAEPFTVEINSIGFLEVSETFPLADAMNVSTDSPITVIFNRPVVPLTLASDTDANLPDPLQISPALAGSGEWLNTSIYVYTPESALAGGTRYTVTVPSGLEAVDGELLSEPFTFNFTTEPPQITNLTPEPQAGNVPLDTSIQVRFNQPIDRASAENAFVLASAMPGRGPAMQPATGSFEWADDDSGFRFIPNQNLMLDTLYRAEFTQEPRGANGGARVQGTLSWDFATVPEPAITGSDPSDGDQAASPFGGFVLNFASPMDATQMTEDMLDGLISIDPEPRLEPEYFYRFWNNSLSVSFPTEPSTAYNISVQPGLQDEYGNTIDAAYNLSYRTAPYSPDVMLNVPSSVGFYNAYREPTQVYLTHRNISQVDLSLYSVPRSTFGQLLGGDTYYNPTRDYTPPQQNLIQSWSIPSQAPENAQRYELLTLGQRGNAIVDCPGAPASRLQVGDVAIVTTEPDALRVRQSPPDGQQIDAIFRGYQLPVVGGPVCANNIVWWEVELRDGSTGWVAEGLPEEYFIDLLRPAATTEVNVQEGIGGSLEPGIYYLSANAPELRDRNRRPQDHMLVVSTAVLTMKASIDGVTIWATDAQSGQPIPNAPITVYDAAFTSIANGVTDADGILRVDLPRVSDLYQRRTAMLEAGGQFGMAFSEWTSGIEPYQFGQSSDFYPRRYRLYVYTDRPIYRPGQPVYFRGVVRQKDDVNYPQVDFDTVPITIDDDRGETIYSENVELSPFGSFSGTFELADDAGLGFYYLDVQLPSEVRFQSEGGGIGFSVAEYRLPEFQVNVTPQLNEVVQGQTATVSVDATYFFGGSVSNADVDYTIVGEPYVFEYDGPGRYDFYDTSPDAGAQDAFRPRGAGLVEDGEALTDANGELLLDVMTGLEDVSQSQRFNVEAVVMDESNQSVAGRSSFIVHQANLYTGVRPQSYVGTAGAATAFEVVTVGWDSEPISGQNVEIEVVERRWSSVQERDDAGRTSWTYEVEEIPVSAGTLTSDAAGEAVFEFTPPQGGVYKATVTSRDADGNATTASTTMWVSSGQYVSWRQQNSNRIDLIADQDNYSVGDTAEILITSPFQGSAEALISVERGGVLQVERVTMNSNSFVYAFQITEDMAPNVFVSVLLVKGVDEFNPVAAFRMGYIQLGVDISRKELDIAIESDVQRTSPQGDATYTIRTTDFSGAPVQAEVGVAVTDLASLSLSTRREAPILNFFYGDQSLSVRTSTPLTINTDQLTQEVLDTIKGGGGGFLADGLVEIRGEFIDTPYWNPTIVTDQNGNAEFTVNFPDNLTTWRLDARAVTAGPEMRVGQDTFDLLSTKPLIIRPTTPRFFVVGDEVELGAVVNNNTEATQQVVVSINSTGVTLNSDRQQTIEIPAGGRGRVTWDAVVNNAEAAVMTFTADAGNFSDGSISPVSIDDNGTLPVYRYEAPETVGTAGVLRETGATVETVALPRRFDVQQGNLTIKASPSLAASALDTLDAIETFEYSSIEYDISILFANAQTLRTLNALDLDMGALDDTIQQEMNVSLQRIYARQKTDGGWGWYSREPSDPQTTAYALLALQAARTQGFDVPRETIQNAQGYLRSRMAVPGLELPQWQLDRQALMLYALAESGAPDVARTSTLFENRERLSLYAQALLAETLNVINPNDSRRLDVLVSNLVGDAITSATGVSWQEDERSPFTWSSDTRTSSMVLSALLKLRPDSDLLPNAVRHLIVQRTGDTWETLHETAWVLRALTDWMLTTGELDPNYSYNIALNGEQLTSGRALDPTASEEFVIDVSELRRDVANAVLFNRTGGNGALYYTAHLTAYLPVPEIEPLERGIIINRRYTTPDDPDTAADESETSITSASIGDLVQVRLTIVAPNDLHFVEIHDPLPAGAEGIDPQLETSQQIGTRPGVASVDLRRRGWGWWWFSNIEFQDEKVVLSASYLPAGTYEYVYTMRPGVVGTYNVIPPTASEIYFPEVMGRGAGSTFTITP